MRKKCEINPEIDIYDNNGTITLRYINGNDLALSELSELDLEFAYGYIDMAKSKKLKEQVLSILHKADKILYFNRLNVPKSMRGNGIGDKLLASTLNYMAKNNNFIINTANNYGEMGQENLINFYKTSGFTLLHKDGLLVYHQDLNAPIPRKNINKLI